MHAARKHARTFFGRGAFLLMVLFLGGCASHTPQDVQQTRRPSPTLPLSRYTIQVGAFANPQNAQRLVTRLQGSHLQAYSFLHESGLNKVRIGDFSGFQAAKKTAEKLREQGLIADYYIVLPKEYAVFQLKQQGEDYVRRNLVQTAHRFVGTPYRWGGESSTTGFDCSGLTMVVYRLNGMNLPRNSYAQYQTGVSVARKDLQPGDLVFFATNGTRRVSHVGIYIGQERFIHAPKRGKKISEASLYSNYFTEHFVGARTYF